jgi:hypothetical protein
MWKRRRAWENDADKREHANGCWCGFIGTPLLPAPPALLLPPQVLIPMFPNKQGGKLRYTACLSTQVGCAMNCQFCYTGRMGLLGNLNTAQIVEQVVQARRWVWGCHGLGHFSTTSPGVVEQRTLFCFWALLSRMYVIPGSKCCVLLQVAGRTG